MMIMMYSLIIYTSINPRGTRIMPSREVERKVS